MKIPLLLHSAIAEAKEALLKDDTELKPYYRNNIYKAFGSNEVGYKARTWLAILAARYSMAKWQGHYPEIKGQTDKDTPKHALFLAKGVLKGEIDAEKASERVDQIAYSMKMAQRYNHEWSAYYALETGRAALVALWVAIGRDPFEGREFTKQDYDDSSVNQDYRDYKWDAALYAFTGYAMEFQDFDDEAATQFWKWWVDEAIPQAWELANSHV